MLFDKRKYSKYINEKISEIRLRQKSNIPFYIFVLWG